MTSSSDYLLRRAGLVLLALFLLFATFSMAGPRSAFLLCIGLGLGLVLEGLRFGFAGPWRVMVTDRDCRGLLAQFLAIGLAACFAFPLLAANPEELSAALAPVGWSMVAFAFVFGMAMQAVIGCGSGTLVNAGSGNLIALAAMPGFVAGSFLGSLHLNWWTGLGSLPAYSLQGLFGSGSGLGVTLVGLAILGGVGIWRAVPGKRRPPTRLLVAAVLLAGLSILNLVVAGQAWGVVYGLGLWGTKLASVAGFDALQTVYWSTTANAERLQQSVLTDVTSLTNIGLIAGAFLVMRWRRQADPQVGAMTGGSWVAVAIAGLVLGYSARIALGCNVGAFFSGVSTGSLHGWAWFIAAFAGSTLGVRLRPLLIRPLPGQK
ncbi:MAG: YeeE/YedE family protein, partial [Pseudohongiellaceae bacterium]